MLNFHIVTVFPKMFESYLDDSILRRAIDEKKISVTFYNPSDFLEVSNNPELMKKLDDRPYGGGPGMVLRPEPYLKAITKALEGIEKYKIIYTSPRGEKFTTDYGKEVARKNKEGGLENLIIITSRYEGLDSRVEEIYGGDMISVGDYVLTGGELPAMIMIDCISRQIGGVLGNANSLEEERVSAGKYYTRPDVLEYGGVEYKVPEVLLSGNHAKIDEWKKENS